MIAAPIYTRLHRAPDVFGISVSTVYHWAEKGVVAIHRRGRSSFLRTDQMMQAIEGKGEELGEEESGSAVKAL